ncbi:MAG: response regulator transcription factor [Bacteroidales bacterium]|nr:response regulator transcription factor [Bacteroidales bacterium]
MIADDHRLVTEGLVKIINEKADTRVVGVSSTLAELTEMLPVLKPEALLLDVAPPDGDGIDALRQLQTAFPELHVIILTMFAEAAVIRRALQNGAQGYVLKGADAEELHKAILVVASGGSYLCAEAQRMISAEKETPVTLTMREREILGLIAEGLTMKEIANRLCLGFETVHSYTKNLRQKLGCGNTASLVRVAMEQHLI